MSSQVLRDILCVLNQHIRNISTFVEDAPHSFLLWQQPAVDARHLFKVRTGADEQQPEHQDAIEGVHYGRKGI